MNKSKKKPISLVGVVVVICIGLWQMYEQSNNGTEATSTERFAPDTGFISSIEARKDRLEDVQAQGSGIVVSLLPDDTKGSRHQRILVKESDGETLLVVHNIDLAPRINDIQVGDQLDYFGEYIWNDKGGLIHWTHHDPNGRHIGGWIKHNGKTYE